MDDLVDWLKAHNVDIQAIPPAHLKNILEDLQGGLTILTRGSKSVRRIVQTVHVRIRHTKEHKVLIFKNPGKHWQLHALLPIKKALSPLAKTLVFLFSSILS